MAVIRPKTLRKEDNGGVEFKLDKESVNRVVKNLEVLFREMKSREIIEPCLEEAIVPLSIAISRNLYRIAGSSGREQKSLVRKMASSVAVWKPKRRKWYSHRLCTGTIGNEFVYWAKKKTRYRTLSKYKRLKTYVEGTKVRQWLFRTGRSFIPTAIEYGHMTAKGTKTTPRPFMRPAKQQVYNRVIKRFADALEKQIKKLQSKMVINNQPRMAA